MRVGLVAEGIPSVLESEAASKACMGGHDGRSCPEFCRKMPNHHLYQKKKNHKKKGRTYFLQLLFRVLGSIVLPRSTVPEQQHYAGGLQLSGKEPGAQRARNTWKKSFMNSFSCDIAEIKLFRWSQKTCSFSKPGYPSLVLEPSLVSPAWLSWSMHHVGNFIHQRFQDIIFALLVHSMFWETTLCSQICVLYGCSFLDICIWVPFKRECPCSELMWPFLCRHVNDAWFDLIQHFQKKNQFLMNAKSYLWASPETSGAACSTPWAKWTGMLTIHIQCS